MGLRDVRRNSGRFHRLLSRVDRDEGLWDCHKAQPIGAGGVAGFDYVWSAPAPVRFSGRYYSSQSWSVHLPWQFFSGQEGNGLPGGGHPVRIRFPPISMDSSSTTSEVTANM